MEEDSKDNPYGLVYKIFSEKLSPNRVLSNIHTAAGYTVDWKTTALALLKGLFGDPADPQQGILEHPGTSPNIPENATNGPTNGRAKRYPMQ